MTADGTYAAQPFTASLIGAAVLGLRDAENPYRRGFNMKSSIYIAVMLALVFVSMAAAQTRLKADTPERFTLASKGEQKEFRIDLRQDELCDLSTDATDEMPAAPVACGGTPPLVGGATSRVPGPGSPSARRRCRRRRAADPSTIGPTRRREAP